MELNYYRDNINQSEIDSWKSAQFTSDTDLSQLDSTDLVTFNGQPVIRQHGITCLTGKDTCRAHHFAKHLAIQVLQSTQHGGDSRCKVLWIDTIHSPHAARRIFDELNAHATGKDDLDHFMPYCGLNMARAFGHVIRDAVNHNGAAFLFIGYNMLGKRTSTTGDIGKELFPRATDVFSLSTVREVTTVRHAGGLDLSRNPDDTQFHFTIGPDNLPRQVDNPRKNPGTGIDDDTLRQIMDGIHDPAASPEALLRQITARHRALKQQSRQDALLAQLHRLNLLPHQQEQQEQEQQQQQEQEQQQDQLLPCRRRVVLTLDDEDNITHDGMKIEVVPVWKWLLQ